MDEIDRNRQQAPAQAERKPYIPPALTLFGHVAALTQSTNCSATNDSTGSCGAAIGGNMGMN